VETVHTYFPGKPITLVFGASEDKDISGMFSELLPHVQTLVVVQSSHPRATPIGELKQKALPFECRVLVVEDISQALPAALSQTEENGLIVATGSLYIVGELRSAWLHILGEDGYNNCT
jgi:dihydrofolate synthase/folylpolyglutamate synthase